MNRTLSATVQFDVGERVQHPRYGIGTIHTINLRRTMWRPDHVSEHVSFTVQFDGYKRYRYLSEKELSKA